MADRRGIYMTQLRNAIRCATRDLDRVSLDELERRLGDFDGDLPGRVTLAKAITGLGWAKLPGRAGAIYRRPEEKASPA